MGTPGTRAYSAVTLVELLVATILVLIVTGGVFVADLTLRRMSDTAAMDIQRGMETAALAEMIRGDIRKVHGDLVDPDDAVFIDSASKTMCFRHDDQEDTTGTYTPADYTDDEWVCYRQVDNQVYRCAGLSATTTTCASGVPVIGYLSSFTTELSADAATGAYVVEVRLVNDNVVMTFRESPMGF